MKTVFTQTAKTFVSRRGLLQLAVAVGGLVPVSAGAAGILLGPAMVEHFSHASLSLDSHFRYLSGLLLGIGLGFWSCLPDIERKTERFQLLVVIVFIGGLGRLCSLVLLGPPDKGMLFGLAMELVVTPALALWQRRLAAGWR